MAQVLVERHLCKDGPVWGLARRDPEGKLYGDLAYEEYGSAAYWNLVKQHNLWDKVPPLTDQERKEALKFWQSWQDPETGLFKDPRDPNRMVGEKYVVNLIRAFGGEPLYPQKASRQMAARDESGAIDTRAFLDRAKNDPDWAHGGWAAGSHAGYLAREVFCAVNEGQTELIPDLEKGLEYILSHQDPATGLWGPPSASLDRRLGGALKVITRLYHSMGMNVPHTRQLADSLIKYERSGDWYRVGSNFCVPQNVVILVAYCLEVSDYRRADLLWVLESTAREYQEWVLPDGSLLLRRGDPSSVAVDGVLLVGLGTIGGYLGWDDWPLTIPPQKAPRAEWDQYRYRPFVRADGSVKVIDTKKERFPTR